MIARCFVVFGFFKRKNGAIMAAITATVTAITEMVRVRMEAVPHKAIMGQPTLNSVRHLVSQLAEFTSHFATTEWGGNHGFLLLVIIETKKRLFDWIQDLEYGRIKWPKTLNPKIEDNTKGHELLQLQKDHKINWKEYTFQDVVDDVAVEAIVAAVDAQYMEDIKED